MYRQATLVASLVLASTLLQGCGGGSSSSADSAPTAYDCASNAVAKTGVSRSEVTLAFGSKVIRGQFNQSGVGPGGGAILTLLADGTGGSFGSPLIFGISSVCASASYPNMYFVSGTWAVPTYRHWKLCDRECFGIELNI